VGRVTDRDAPKERVPADGVAADGVAADGVPVDGVPVDGVAAPGRPAVGDVAEEALSRVADIADRARRRNLDRAGELAGWIRAAEQGELSPQACEEAADVAHQLAGSAGTFGYFAATELARRIERTFLDGEQDGEQDGASAEEHVQELIKRLNEPPESAGI
jgi:HPt (histidine-containing phosphotransfer) domain-containing protein